MAYSKQEIYEMFQEEEPECETIKVGNWIDKGKRSYRSSYVKIEDKYYEIEECRSGSYFTDYYYEDPEIHEVTPKEVVITKTVYERVMFTSE